MNTWDDVVFRFDIVTFTREELRKERGKKCIRKSCQVVKKNMSIIATKTEQNISP